MKSPLHEQSPPARTVEIIVTRVGGFRLCRCGFNRFQRLGVRGYDAQD
ncbi:hypothetical protein OSCI_3350007 [Kamptonema sp. PCC 6506]|nr:hypothetical protein OSCI_3350007 [Kamptonema sp. PCC 6506]